MIEGIFVVAIVLLAASYLMLRAWRKYVRKSDSGCGACGTCPAAPRRQAAAGGSDKPGNRVEG